jgi:outer membrane protein assembly factor BamB
LELPYSSDDLSSRYSGVPNIAPIAISGNRTLIPVGDIVYLVDASNRVLWKFSVEPNFIFDAAVDSRGLIYLAVFDGSLVALDDRGKEVWSTFMNGSANYTQLEPYGDGVLAVISMESYRKYKGSTSEDILLFWRDKKEVWRTEFPRNGEVHVSGERILAIKSTKEGKEIVQIR